MRPEVQPWWRQAGADLQTAELARQGGQYYAVSWFAQQAVEKGLKALYLERHRRHPPRTHDVQFLGRQLGVPPSVQVDLDILAPAFDMARYPDSTGMPSVDAVTVSDADDHLNAGRRTLGWLAGEFQIP